MSETYGTTGTHNDADDREHGAVEAAPSYGTDTHGTDTPGTSTYGTDTHGTDTPGTSTYGTDTPGTDDAQPTGGFVTDRAVSTSGGSTGMSTSGDTTTGDTTTADTTTGDTKEVAKEEARATGEQAKEGARHVAEVGKDEVKNVAQETSQQAKELWNQTRTQLMDQSAQQQTRVAAGLRSLSQELSEMAHGSEQHGVASDLAQQASSRMGDVASWLDQRDPGSLVSEVKQFARQRPGAFLATAAILGVVGGRLSRGLVADHQDESDAAGVDSGPASTSGFDTAAGPGESLR